MANWLRRLGAGGAVALISLCVQSGGLAPRPADAQAASMIRVAHVATGIAGIRITLDERPFFNALNFRSVTSYVPVAASPHSVKVSAVNRPNVPLVDGSVALEPGRQLTLVVVGEAPALNVVTLVDDNVPPPPGQAKVRFVHGIPDVPAVDVLARGGRVLFDGVGFRGEGSYVTVPAGAYNLDVRLDDQSETLLSWSGVTLSAGQIVTFVAVKAADGTVTPVPIVYRGPTPTMGQLRMPRTGTGIVADHAVDYRHLILIAAVLAACCAIARVRLGRTRSCWRY